MVALEKNLEIAGGYQRTTYNNMGTLVPALVAIHHTGVKAFH